jgi:hypothetical protein
MRLSAFLLPLVVAIALGLAACRGDDSSDSDDFIADADAICTDQAEQNRDVVLAVESVPADEKASVNSSSSSFPV